MTKECKPSAECFALLLRDCLKRGEAVHIDDLGIFIPGPDKDGFRFMPNQMQRVFIAYVEEDGPVAKRLYRELTDRGFSPWIDKKKLLPGQNWTRAIESAIETSDFFIPCFSSNSASKRGVFHAELRYALDCAAHLPLDEIFIIPVRIDQCEIPHKLRSHIHCVDLFPDWKTGLDTITTAMQQQMAQRGKTKR